VILLIHGFDELTRCQATSSMLTLPWMYHSPTRRLTRARRSTWIRPRAVVRGMLLRVATACEPPQGCSSGCPSTRGGHLRLVQIVHMYHFFARQSNDVGACIVSRQCALSSSFCCHGPRELPLNAESNAKPATSGRHARKCARFIRRDLFPPHLATRPNTSPLRLIVAVSEVRTSFGHVFFSKAVSVSRSFSACERRSTTERG
jgi:hypothetical protein